MTLVQIPGAMLTPPTTTLSAHQSSLIDAADEKVAFIFRCPPGFNGTITGFGFGTNTVATGATVDCRLETVDGTTGLPSGTLWGTNTNIGFVINNTDDNTTLECTFTSNATVAEGDLVAVVIANPAASFGNMNIASTNSVTINNESYVLLYTGTWAKTANRGGVVYLIDSAGTRICADNCVSAATSTGVACGTGTTPDEYGVRVSLPFRCRVRGILAILTPSAGVTLDVKLYNLSNTVLTSGSFDTDNLAANSLSEFAFTWGTPYTLEANTDYRVTILPTTATTLTNRYFTFLSTTTHGAMPYGTNYQWTERTDAGSWTDRSLRRPLFSLIVDQVDDGRNFIYNVME